MVALRRILSAFGRPLSTHGFGRDLSEELGAMIGADLCIDLFDQIGWEGDFDGLETHGVTFIQCATFALRQLARYGVVELDVVLFEQIAEGAIKFDVGLHPVAAGGYFR